MIYGEGKMWTDEWEYEGMFVNGWMKGNGQYCEKNGRILKGEFDHDMLNGKGTIIEKNGNKISGIFKNNIRVWSLY